MLTHGSEERGRKEKKNGCWHSLNLSVCFGEERSNFKLFLVGILDIAGYDHTKTENGLEGLKMLAHTSTDRCATQKNGHPFLTTKSG